MSRILCACNGKICEGLCKEKNLYRKRKDLDRCPAAYDEQEERRRVHQ